MKLLCHRRTEKGVAIVRADPESVLLTNTFTWDGREVRVKSRRRSAYSRAPSKHEDRWWPIDEWHATSIATTYRRRFDEATIREVSRMSSLQVPELRLPADDGDGGGPGGGAARGTVPLLLVPPSNVPRRRHSWICRWVCKLRFWRVYCGSYTVANY